MFRNNFYHRISGTPHCDKSVKCPVDQFASQEFNIGENGHVMSDIEVIMKVQDEDLRRVLLQRLDVQKVIEDSRSDYEKLRDVVPRYIQTPAEIQQFIRVFHELYPAELPITLDESIDKKETNEVVSQPVSE